MQNNDKIHAKLQYANGYGVAQNYAVARQWFEKAAAQGNENAKRALRQLTAEGH